MRWSRWLQVIQCWVKEAVAQNPTAASSAISLLVRDTNADVRVAVADNPRCSATDLERLAADPCLDVRCAVAENPKTPAHVLRFACGQPRRQPSRRPCDEPRGAAGRLFRCSRRMTTRRCGGRLRGNPGTRSADVQALAHDVCDHVRTSALERAEIPEAILALLEADPSDDVRWSVARNPNTPLALLERLARGATPALRMALAAHRASSPRILGRLAEESGEHLTDELVKHPHFPLECGL